MKRLSILLLALTLCFTMLAGCGSNGVSPESTTTESTGTGSSTPKTADELLTEKYENPVKITCVLSYLKPENPNTPDSVTPETQAAVKRFKEDLNIELEYSWVVNPDQFAAKFGAELAAGNLPDVMMLNANQFQDIQSQGGLADLSEAYNLYSNDVIEKIVNFDGEVINAGMRDGKLYGLPQALYPGFKTSQTYYDMNKLKKAGIDTYEQLPKTIAEFEALCDKLMTLDLDGNGKPGDPIIPANQNYIDAGLADFTPVFHAYKSYGPGWYDDGSGNLVNTSIQPELKTALSKLNEWYKKGYFAKDFAALDVWAADSKIVTDFAAGKYAIMFGAWWNYTHNAFLDNKNNDPDSQWVVGPTLTADGGTPKIMIPRNYVSDFTVVGKNCKNPEAVFKMMNWCMERAKKVFNPDWLAKASKEELLEKDSFVLNWLPFRYPVPDAVIENYKILSEKDKVNSLELKEGEALNNTEFWWAWGAYLQYKKGEGDVNSWGAYMSRIYSNGGVAKMYELVSNAEKQYDEVYMSTPTMITKSGELDKYRNSTFLSMIMGETPISNFDKYVSEWKKLGGDEIQAEVNQWYKSIKK